MAHAGVGHQPLEVGLGEGHQSAVDNTDDPQRHRHPGEVEGGVREEWDDEANESVSTGLEQQRGQYHAPCGGRLGVGVGEPVMERHGGQLHGKGGEEPKHQPGGNTVGDGRAEQKVVVEGKHAGGLLVEKGQGEDRDQHQHPGRLRVEQELQRGVDAVLVAPERDDEVHRDQHHLPEEVEQEHVEGHEHADDAGQHCVEAEIEQARSGLDLGPGREHGGDTH